MSRVRKVFLFVAVPLLIIFVSVAVYFLRSNPPVTQNATKNNDQNTIGDQSNPKDAIKAGQSLSNNHCEGEGVPYKLSASPMKMEDFTHIIPYGLMVGGHVTPIDHQYFSPADYKSPIDAYEVRAMADSTIVDIGTRKNETHPATEYRLVFTVSCTFFYYYDLVTSLAPEIKAEFDKNNRNGFFSGTIVVKAGQLIGRIGGRTLDFAVWDTTKPVTGFIKPSSYEAERWKLYTADPLNYYTDELKASLLSKYVRQAEPVSGKIDYDIDGKMIGNWFEEGSNGYMGTEANRNAGAYWKTHLSISPDHFDPTQSIISMGFLYKVLEHDDDMQYAILPGSASPASVGVDTGLVKYDLGGWDYVKTDGSKWDKMGFTADAVTLKPNPSQHFGCALGQLIETQKLKFELFVGKNCSAITSFTDKAKIYTR
ncbi:MAG: hypothetical protein HZB70_02595 [Candidatus Berkelbacteria bacterium]|nr:MAG: hypothetical protein HZB70_02595 [Candidatus Berkelbacteria bacterium]QQG51805.1 MAG: hypothetical protein HY845_00400 [Candidatus Berkelbacteria bacterium]